MWSKNNARRRLITSFISAIAIGLCSPTYAQQSSADTSPAAQLSVEDLVAFALKHNASLQTGLRSVDIARAAVITSSALPNPRIEFDSGRNSVAYTAAQAGTVTVVGISQLIENPALRSARVDSALFAENTSLELLGQIRNELVAQVKLRAYEYLLRREEALAASDALALLEQIRERVRLRVETGEAGRYELIKSDAEIINARQKKQTAQLQIAQAAISLNRLAGGQLPASWELDAQLADAHELPQLANLKETALRDNPELRVLSSELDRNKSRINEAEASRWAGVDIKLAQINQPDVRQNLVGVSVQIPLLDQKRGPRAEAIADVLSSCSNWNFPGNL
jgi:cobalt-zinc-cadmium efflux system outer membrane protein